MELAFHDDELWLVIHSGSRGVGHKVAQHYMQQASGSNREFECTAPLHVDEPEGKEYANVLQFGQDFALLNRLEMAKTVTEVLREVLGQDELDYELWVNQHHNHAIKTEDGYIHRKGATPASKGEQGVIPANMRDGTILVEGLGDANFLYSSSHGAGRCLSRTRAKASLDLATFKKQMSGVVGTVNERTLDEAPDAYKPIDSVMKAQQTSVRELKRLKPLINWKGD
jgi:tRNA-splicing ligase RtcB